MEITVDKSLRHWWFFLIRGILFVVTAIYMLASPTTSFIALGFMFGLIIFISGVSELLHSIREHGAGNRSWHLFLGLINVILGLVLMVHIIASMDILRIIVGISFVISGLSLFRVSSLIKEAWIFILGGVLVLLFGLLFLFNPTFGDMTLILWTAIAFILTGVFNIFFGIKMRPILP